MWRCLIVGFVLLLSTAESLVQFTHSSIYDEFDFVGQSQVEIATCSNSTICAFFVVISNDSKYADIYDNIQLSTATRESNTTLTELAAMRSADLNEIIPHFIIDDASNFSFFNDNKDQVGAPLAIYVADLSADQIWADVSGVFDAADITNGVKRGKIVTVLSVVPFTTTITQNEYIVASLATAGFDNAYTNEADSPDNCTRLFTNRADSGSFQINGPIATLVFTDSTGNIIESKNTIKTSLNIDYDHIDLKSNGFVTSQGFIGCIQGQNYRSSLYKDTVQFHISSEKSQNLLILASIVTDVENPLNIHTDNSLNNLLGETFQDTSELCLYTHELVVTFTQTSKNSFALMYEHNSGKCNDTDIGKSPTPPTKTTVKLPTVITTNKPPATIPTSSKPPNAIATTTKKECPPLTQSTTSSPLTTTPTQQQITTSGATGALSASILILPIFMSL